MAAKKRGWIMTLRHFEIVANFIWMHLEAFQAHMRTAALPKKNNFEIFASFLEENFEEFQVYLEDEYEIEGSEAESFVDELRGHK
jgi:hypothetical protein